MKRLVPFAYATSIYDINVDFYKKINVKFLLIDLDNTLDTHKTLVPSDRAKKLITSLKENNLIPIIISNNKEQRVKKYSSCLNVKYLCRARKPFKFKIEKFLNKENINKNDVIMIGDQLMTDIRCAERLRIKSILTEKLWPKDQFVTKLLRWLDKIKRKRLKKDNLLINWRDIYGRIK